ncbi:hypothetical protein AOL_s00078g610 [Orbilia oligospora ATCC 24927]|uniref:Fucose-specific lectin n=1 Tax=Arthrobotrys oligospora (strain ATCC 24927 / CBS 115.81 / DSM 1491) TaxID=756982 RepID=G1XCG3_ARTOA|nr:hypothetical protein AOL_s00078g610 [Orbilia oligospora ATCC 24927]EGX49226.1 hypothetical protein AOL_s00078g610 [Orbilia oligospora ATCC 24927]
MSIAGSQATRAQPNNPIVGPSSTSAPAPAPAPVPPVTRQPPAPAPTLPRPVLPTPTLALADNTPKMAAVTALINPLTACKGGKTKVSIYSLLSTGKLAFEQRLLGDATSKLRGAGGAAQLQNMSYLSSMVIDDDVHVFGVNTDKKLALVSPAYQATDLVIESGYFAGCSDGESDGWFFFQSEDVATSTYPLYEMPVWGTKLENAKKLEGLIAPCKKTSIAACYDGEHRWIAYQSSENAIVLRNIDTDKHAIVEDSRWTTKLASPIGVVYVPGHSTRGHIFIYYLHQDLSLRRAFVEIDETFDFRGYGEQVVVDKAVNIASFTQLTIVADPTCKSNYIYAARNPTTTQVATIPDNWGASITRLQEYYYSQIKHNHLIGNEKEGHHHGPGHVHHENNGGDGFPYFPGRPGSEHGGHNGGIHFGGHEHPHGWRSPPPSYGGHSYNGGLYSHGRHARGLPFGDMNDLEVELGKVKMNALLKMHLGEPRVEYYNKPVHYGGHQ